MGIRESLLNTITSVGNSDFVRIVTSAGASSKATLQNVIKSFETGLGAKSSLTTSDYIRVVGSDNNLYKQTLSDVAAKIIENYTSSVLAYKNQSIQSAINNAKALANMKTLTSADNVNNLSKGSYASSSSSNYPSNLPSGETRGILYVYQGLGYESSEADLAQEFISYPNASHYHRFYRTSSQTWSAWEKEPTRAEVDALNSKTTQTFTSSTATGSGTASKVGQVVTVHLSFEGYTATSTSWQPLCELPSGYRPSRQIDVLAFDNAARSTSEQPLQLRISPSGTVKLYAFTAKTYNPYGCVTFII